MLRRVMKSVVHNFLGTYISRYSDYRGYWLLGQLPSSPREWTLDLLAPSPVQDTPEDAAHRLAIRRFAEQVRKAGRSLDTICEAKLNAAWDSKEAAGWQGGYKVAGHDLQFSIRVVMHNGRVYEDSRSVFVAPHDPEKELRRNEEHWGI